MAADNQRLPWRARGEQFFEVPPGEFIASVRAMVNETVDAYSAQLKQALQQLKDSKGRQEDVVKAPRPLAHIL